MIEKCFCSYHNMRIDFPTRNQKKKDIKTKKIGSAVALIKLFQELRMVISPPKRKELQLPAT